MFERYSAKDSPVHYGLIIRTYSPTWWGWVRGCKHHWTFRVANNEHGPFKLMLQHETIELIADTEYPLTGYGAIFSNEQAGENVRFAISFAIDRYANSIQLYRTHRKTGKVTKHYLR